MKNNITLKYGIIAAIGVGVLLFASSYAYQTNGTIFQDYSIYVIWAATGLFLFEFRKPLEEMNFKIGFKNALKMNTITAFVSSLFYYLLIKFQNRDLLKLVENQLLEAFKTLEFPKEQVDIQIMIIKSHGPLVFGMSFLFAFLMRNLVWSAFFAIMLKKNKVIPADEQYF